MVYRTEGDSAYNSGGTRVTIISMHEANKANIKKLVCSITDRFRSLLLKRCLFQLELKIPFQRVTSTVELTLIISNKSIERPNYILPKLNTVEILL